MEQKDAVAVLNTGAKMPLVGYGTFLSKPGEVGPAVEAALKAGYRHIDCAECYENQAEIGAVFNKVFNDPESGIKREDVFITSKLWVTYYHPDKVKAGLEKALQDLQLSYLDLYLMHIPISSEKKDGKIVATRRTGYSLHDTWKVLETCHKAGLAKAIGVSNFPAILMNDFQNGAEIVPAVNQIERHPYLSQMENVKFNQDLGVVVTAYAPLGAMGLMGKKFDKLKPLFTNDVIVAIAAKHKHTPAQVLIRWSVDSGVVVIPKSVTPSRIVENFSVFDFKLDEEDMKQIAALDCDFRTFAQDWPGVPCFK